MNVHKPASLMHPQRFCGMRPRHYLIDRISLLRASLRPNSYSPDSFRARRMLLTVKEAKSGSPPKSAVRIHSVRLAGVER
jgi:hypothetical protein